MAKIPENVSSVAKAILPLMVIVVLFLVLGQIGISKVMEVRAQITTAQDDERVLTEKLDMLRTVAVNGTKNVNAATESLPDSNPVLTVVAQLGSLSSSSGTTISSVKSTTAGAVTDGSVNSVEIDFSVLGSTDQIETFLRGISTIAPITVLNSIKLTGSGGSVLGTISVKAFWAPFPTKLPATIEEFQDLTPEDNTTLTTISNLTQPTFVSLPPPSSAGKSDPFSL